MLFSTQSPLLSIFELKNNPDVQPLVLDTKDVSFKVNISEPEHLLQIQALNGTQYLYRIIMVILQVIFILININ